jgi:hypothetical protein
VLNWRWLSTGGERYLAEQNPIRQAEMTVTTTWSRNQ